MAKPNYTQEQLDNLSKTPVPEDFFGPGGLVAVLDSTSKAIKGAVRENRGCSLTTEMARESLVTQGILATVTVQLLQHPILAAFARQILARAHEDAVTATYLMSTGVDVFGMDRETAETIVG